MTEIENVSLIGLGAIGTVLAVQLQQALPNGAFSIIADSERKKRIQRRGVMFNGRRYDFPFASEMTEIARSKNLILIATKANALPTALDAIAPYVGEHTLILSLMNGITSEAIIAERFGSSQVLPSYFLGHTSTRNANEVTHDGIYNIFFGESDNRIRSPNVERISRFFDRTGIPYQIPDDMLSSMWQKLIINIGCNQTTALLRCSYGHIQRNEQAMSLAVGMMEEAVKIAMLLGISSSEKMVDQAVEVIRSMNPADESSMLQDIKAEHTTEVDIFAGTLCRLSSELGCSVPLNRAVLQILTALEK